MTLVFFKDQDHIMSGSERWAACKMYEIQAQHVCIIKIDDFSIQLVLRPWNYLAVLIASLFLGEASCFYANADVSP